MIKAMQEVDWNKVNVEVKNATEIANDFVVKLGNYQQDREIKQEKLKQAQQRILLDRIEQHEQLKRLEKMEEDKKKTCPVTAKKKKIVQI